MHRMAIPFLALTTSLIVGHDLHAQRGGRPGLSSPGRNGWESSLAEGVRQAKSAGKPIMLVFRCDP
jgi:hypothetical protein